MNRNLKCARRLVLLTFLFMTGCGAAGPTSPVASSSAVATASVAAPASVKPAPASLSVGASGKLDTLTVGLLPPDAYYWAEYADQAQGYSKRLGLDVKYVQLGTPATAAQALIGGSVDVATGSADAFINAIEQGAGITMVGQYIGNPALGVVVQPEIKTWADVKGGTIAVSSATDGAANVFRLMAKQQGLVAQKDYSFLPVGTTPARYAALKANQTKGAIMTEALTIQAVNDGYRLLARSDLPHYAFIMMVVSKGWGGAHRDLVTRRLSALSQAVDWVYDAKNKDAAIDLVTKNVQVSADIASKTYRDYVEQGQGQILTKKAQVDVEGLKNNGDVLKELGLVSTVDTARWTDPSYSAAVK